VGTAFSPTVLLFGLFLLGIAIGNGLVSPSLSSLVSKGAPDDKKGGVMGIYQSAGSLARTIGPPVAGLMFDKISPGFPLLFSGFLMAAALAASFATRQRYA
jgi:MFS family permease